MLMKRCLIREISLPLFRVIARAECLHDVVALGVYRSDSSTSHAGGRIRYQQETDPSTSIDISSFMFTANVNSQVPEVWASAEMGILSRADRLLTVTMVDHTRITPPGRTGRFALCCWKLNGILRPIKWMCRQWAPLCLRLPAPRQRSNLWVRQKIQAVQHIGMCDPRVSLELQKTAEDLIYDTDTEAKCQSQVNVDLPSF